MRKLVFSREDRTPFSAALEDEAKSRESHLLGETVCAGLESTETGQGRVPRAPLLDKSWETQGRHASSLGWN